MKSPYIGITTISSKRSPIKMFPRHCECRRDLPAVRPDPTAMAPASWHAGGSGESLEQPMLDRCVGDQPPPR